MPGPVAALAGGALIGASAAMLLWTLGRIAGVSGILGGVLLRARGDVAWRIAFLVGLIAAAAIYFALMPAAHAPRADFPRALLVVAGVLVGFGTRLGNGCTSGHGVCGLARFSTRSLAAVITFMATAMLTVFVVRHVLGAP